MQRAVSYKPRPSADAELQSAYDLVCGLHLATRSVGFHLATRSVGFTLRRGHWVSACGVEHMFRGIFLGACRKGSAKENLGKFTLSKSFHSFEVLVFFFEKMLLFGDFKIRIR